MGDYEVVNGQRLAPAVAHAIASLAVAFRDQFGLDVIVSSGRRTYDEQKALFLNRYRAQATGNGPFNDVRFWQGVRYVRVGQGGTVAQPGTSRHEDDHAVDIRDSGSSPGLTTIGTKRSNWLKGNCSRFGFAATGFSFGEAWHIDYTGDPWDGSSGAHGDESTDDEKPFFPVVSVENLALIGDVRGFQKIARVHGAKTEIDNSWGPESRKGFQMFLDEGFGSSLMRWLHEECGYDGDDRLGPIMTAALSKANTGSFNAN